MAYTSDYDCCHLGVFVYVHSLLRHVKDWDPCDNDIHTRVPAHRIAISQIDGFHTENSVHT